MNCPSLPSLPRYINEREAAEITGFALQSLRNWRYLGRGPAYVKIGRQIRYPFDELVAYMEHGRVTRMENKK